MKVQGLVSLKPLIRSDTSMVCLLGGMGWTRGPPWTLLPSSLVVLSGFWLFLGMVAAWDDTGVCTFWELCCSEGVGLVTGASPRWVGLAAVI